MQTLSSNKNNVPASYCCSCVCLMFVLLMLLLRYLLLLLLLWLWLTLLLSGGSGNGSGTCNMEHTARQTDAEQAQTPIYSPIYNYSGILPKCFINKQTHRRTHSQHTFLCQWLWRDMKDTQIYIFNPGTAVQTANCKLGTETETETETGTGTGTDSGCSCSCSYACAKLQPGC